MAYYNTYITYYEWLITEVIDWIEQAQITIQLTEVNGLYMTLLSD